jgi:2-keto-4-pentenoate hydratase/2-oxohepta-3-ene-1,7-dioic acid hydratase in catechol pathway
MKIVRYLSTALTTHYGAMQTSGETLRIEGDIFGVYSVTNEHADVQKLLAPIVPTAFWCIGINYGDHAFESGAAPPKFPVLFMKSVMSLQNPGDPIELPRTLRSDKVDYEGELAVVIGKTCKNVTREHAMDYVLGYTCANDVSARDWQREWGGGQYCRGKTFDTFAPLGPCIVTVDEIGDPQKLSLRTTLNGKVMQDNNTSGMIFGVAAIIEFLSGSTTLPAGSVILTGTPHGVGMAQNPPVWLKSGDTVTVEIEGIGALTNRVIEEQ